ncbi:MAG: response regulator transcription factor [Chloroflexota bacterium]
MGTTRPAAGKKRRSPGRLKEPPGVPNNPLRCGRLTLDQDQQIITRDGEPLRLTLKEYRLLSTFMTHSGEVLPRKFLIKEIWETDYMGDTRMLDVHIRWIRQKIEDDPSSPLYLRTVRGVGYRFEAPRPDRGHGE